MIIHKVISGFVIQRYDTETKRFIDQDFFEGETGFETVDGEPILEPVLIREFPIRLNQPPKAKKKK